ncbi:MAG: winged helix-turn-helix transcriptional regulator [Candidatus Kerfeldbacteria bacterium]|nr:winged helix-turn-helix transcriptional regulator [Candidatus Kerfeldbacteria bacterium]
MGLDGRYNMVYGYRMTGTPAIFCMHTHPYFRQTALLHRGLCNERRLFVLSLLLQRPHTGVELARLVGIRPACISKHLRVLMTAGLVEGKRVKMAVRFSVIDRESVRHILYSNTPFS